MDTRNFTSQVRRKRRSAIVLALMGPIAFCLHFALCLSVAGVLAGIYELTFRMSVRAVVSTIVLAGAAIGLTWVRVLAVRSAVSAKPRVVPYFDDRLSADDETWRAFRAGFALAEHLGELDRQATQKGGLPLSRFGFNDDMLSQAVTWHPATDGLETLRLLDRAGEPQGASDSAKALADDLSSLEAVLARASETGRRFALVVRLGDDSFIYPPEMDQRQGSFW
jgi:hypothetical protein